MSRDCKKYILRFAAAAAGCEVSGRQTALVYLSGAFFTLPADVK